MTVILAVGGAAAADRGLIGRIAEDFAGAVLSKIFFGFASAALLYLIFFIGGVAVHALFPGLAGGIAEVYSFRGGASVFKVAALLALIIGPGEEILWRGFVQSYLVQRFGAARGIACSAVLYAFVHVASGNFILVAAALACGLFWGALYQKHRSLLLNSTSHIAWDLAVFLIFPFS